MSKWTEQTVIEAAKKAGVEYEVYDDWNKIAPYGKQAGWTSTLTEPAAIMWHHTAGASKSTSDHPSLNYCRRPGAFAGKARACNALLDRQGKFHFIGAHAQYHAGVGGPITVNGTRIPKDQGNRFIYGVEIEAHNTSEVVPYKKGDMRGMTDLQMTAMSKWSAALCEIMGWDTNANIRHRDWTNGDFDSNPKLPTFGRKIDVQIGLRNIRNTVEAYRTSPTISKPLQPSPAPENKPQPTTPTQSVKPAKPAVRLPVVRVGNVRRNNTNNDILIVQKALKKEVGLDYSSAPGRFGPATEAAYKRWERKLGWAKVNGLPDVKTLTELGKKHGFTVTR